MNVQTRHGATIWNPVTAALPILFALLPTSASAVTLPEIFTSRSDVLRKVYADGFRIGAIPRNSQQEKSRVCEATARLPRRWLWPVCGRSTPPESLPAAEDP